jgi:hypothetical protein
VRLDDRAIDLIAGLLQPGGTLLSFGFRAVDSRLDYEQEKQLPDGVKIVQVPPKLTGPKCSTWNNGGNETAISP